MILEEMLLNLRVELHDMDNQHWEDDVLIRAVNKTVSLMSRLSPQRSIVESLVTRKITGETLTIASDTGTLAYKPIKSGTLTIPGKAENTDFRINHLTGVVTEIGDNLGDTNYTVAYDLDTTMFDISSVLTDYIKIERLEYPIGSLVTADVWGDFLVFKGNISLSEASYLRIIYLCRWTPPVLGTAGDYPPILDDAVIIGSAGQALIFKAEQYVQSAASALSALTAPTDYSYSKPSAPSLPGSPSPPGAPGTDFTEANAALALSASSLVDALGFLATGASKINTATRGDKVGETYGDYCEAATKAAAGSVAEALGYLRRADNLVSEYIGEVTAFGSESNVYANEVSGVIGKHRGEVEAENVGVTNFTSQVNKYAAQVNEQQMKARNFLDIAGRSLASGQAKINEMLVMLGLKAEFPTFKASSEQRA